MYLKEMILPVMIKCAQSDISLAMYLCLLDTGDEREVSTLITEEYSQIIHSI